MLTTNGLGDNNITTRCADIYFSCFLFEYQNSNTALGPKFDCISVCEKNLTLRGCTAISGQDIKTFGQGTSFELGPSSVGATSIKTENSYSMHSNLNNLPPCVKHKGYQMHYAELRLFPSSVCDMDLVSTYGVRKLNSFEIINTNYVIVYSSAEPY